MSNGLNNTPTPSGVRSRVTADEPPRHFGEDVQLKVITVIFTLLAFVPFIVFGADIGTDGYGSSILALPFEWTIYVPIIVGSIVSATGTAVLIHVFAGALRKRKTILRQIKALVTATFIGAVAILAVAMFWYYIGYEIPYLYRAVVAPTAISTVLVWIPFFVFKRRYPDVRSTVVGHNMIGGVIVATVVDATVLSTLSAVFIYDRLYLDGGWTAIGTLVGLIVYIVWSVRSVIRTRSLPQPVEVYDED